MKAVILAAGRGTRLNHIGRNTPKGMLDFFGKTLLQLSLNTLQKAGIEETIIVVGHLKELIIEKTGNHIGEMKIRYTENTEYASTGSMYSLSKLSGKIEDDILLLESDLLYEKRAIYDLLQNPNKDVILVSKLLNSGDDVFVCVDEKSRVIMLGKKIDEEYSKSVAGALVGISKLSKTFLSKLFEQAESEYLRGEKNQHYEECILRTCLKGSPVYSSYDDDLKWIEIDNENDLKRAKTEIWPYITGEMNE